MIGALKVTNGVYFLPSALVSYVISLPNDQNQACLSFSMARKGRMKSIGFLTDWYLRVEFLTSSKTLTLGSVHASMTLHSFKSSFSVFQFFTFDIWVFTKWQM